MFRRHSKTDFSITEEQRVRRNRAQDLPEGVRAARDTLARTETLRNLVGRKLVQQMDLASGGLGMGMF